MTLQATLALPARCRVLARVVGAFAYLASLAGFYVLFAFLIDGWLPRTVDRGPSASLVTAVAIDVALLALFGLQHTVMARPTFKRWWTRVVPAALERSTYMIATLLVLAVLVYQWRPIPHTIWDLAGTASVAALGVYVLGWAVVFVSLFLLDHLELTGLRQTWLDGRGARQGFRSPLLYRVVRHPMMVGWLIVFWATPRMTAGHLLFASVMTIYILIALWFEERNLVETFGDDYREYQKSVPKLLPVRLRP